MGPVAIVLATTRGGSLRGHGYFKRLGARPGHRRSRHDPSGIGTYSQVGAAYGTSLLWSMPVVAVMAATVQETAARLGLQSGVRLSTLIRRHLGRRVLVVCVLLVAIANTFNIAADLAAMGAAIRLEFALPQGVLTVGLAIGIVTLELFVAYHRYSRVLRVLALSLISYLVVAFLVHADWGAVARGFVRFEIPQSR